MAHHKTKTATRRALIDIGSNSVRLVVHEACGAFWYPLHDEKTTCALGADLDKTGRLSPKGKQLASAALTRYQHLANAYDASLHTLATEAMRRAADGPAFKAELENSLNLPINIISGAQEAAYSAHGLKHALPQANGLMGDFGGSSLELAQVDNGGISHTTSVPLGALNLSQADNPAKAIKQALADYPWHDLPQLYAIGGTWRALARFAQLELQYPLPLIHLYSLPVSALRPIIEGLINGQLKPTAHKQVSKQRRAFLPAAALLLDYLIEQTNAGHVTFVSSGVRDGWYNADNNAPTLRDESRAFAPYLVRWHNQPEQVTHWLTTFLTQTTSLPGMADYAATAITLADIARHAMHKERAALAYRQILNAPLQRLDHQGRAWLALCLFTRYGGKANAATVYIAKKMLDKPMQQSAILMGHALRCAKLLGGGQDGLLLDNQLEYHNQNYIINGNTPLKNNPTLVKTLNKLNKQNRIIGTS